MTLSFSFLSRQQNELSQGVWNKNGEPKQQSPGMKPGEQNRAGRKMYALLTIAGYHIPVGASKRRKNCSGETPNYRRTAFGSGQDTVLDRHDFSKHYYHQGINFLFQVVIPGTYPDNAVWMPRYDDVLGVPLVHLWHETTHYLLASASEGVHTRSRAAINAPHMDVSASTWHNVSLQRQITPPDFNTKSQGFFSKNVNQVHS